MRPRRVPIWLRLILAVVALIAAVPALWILVSLTATPLFRTAEDVPTVILSAPPPAWAATVENARHVVQASVAGQNLPGLSVAVGIDGDIVWAQGFGLADLNSNVSVAPNHRFRIGTASPMLTSAAVGLLLQSGRLKLDDEIQTYVPKFPKKNWPISLRQLMGHTAGLVPEGSDGLRLFTNHCQRPQDAVEHFAAEPLLFQPGTQYSYSSYGWILVSAAVEAAAKEPFLTFMQDRIFEPLGMHDTVPDSGHMDPGEDFPPLIGLRELIHDPDATRDTSPGPKTKPASLDRDGRATSYFTRFGSDPKRGMHLMRFVDYSCYAGATVFDSTPSDLARFGMAMNSGKLLQPATVETLQTVQRLASGAETGYGLGWNIKNVTLAGKPTRMIGNDGDLLGGTPELHPFGQSPSGRSVVSLMTFPEYRMAVAVTSNISFANTSSIAEKIAQVFAARRTLR